MMRKVLLIALLIGFAREVYAQSQGDLHFDQLATTWDEGIPMGNGIVGALLWQKDDKLRFSLDRADIWDLRPMKDLHREEFSYAWVQGQVAKKDYKIVQQYFDAPYDREPAPSKIPAGAMEFSLPGKTVTSVHLYLDKAYSEVIWGNGAKLQTFVHATAPVGWFRFENIPSDFTPELIAPAYQGDVSNGEVNSLVGDDLARLGYQQGKIIRSGDHITYTQEGWGGFTYEIAVDWKRINSATLEGIWSISAHYPDKATVIAATDVIAQQRMHGYTKDFQSHAAWWTKFWSQSSIQVPDERLQKQWYLEQYKFGSAARRGAPPISLQAVWTADNGRIPPWKGDFHHDLNTQLSYWPAYSGNHLEEAMGYLDHLLANKSNYARYTKTFFGKEGIAVPGVTTLDGTEMGGWIQYSLSPTVSSWLSQHFYLQWRYSMDKDFLRESAYPWVKDVAIFIEQITALDEKGKRKLPISSSPEIRDNSLAAWFPENTNYDLALMKYQMKIASELAQELGLASEAARWKKIGDQFPPFAISANTELMFAPGVPYYESHRHFSHAMAIHPLGLIRYEDGPAAQAIIKNTLHQLDSVGPDLWCGYSYSWLANMKARARDGEGASKALDIFARAFCLPNSFHVNGDQTKTGLSKFTYRPFTLEGNFAFASGLQEMLLQSYAGYIEVMPAVPDSWQNISFETLRAEGAFLIDAKKTNGKIESIKILSEKGGDTKVKLPFVHWKVTSKKNIHIKDAGDGFIHLTCQEGGYVIITRN